MQGDETERRREPRRNAERRNAAQAPRADEDGNDATQDPSYVPSPLTARELQAWDPATSADRRAAAGDRRLPRPSDNLPRRIFKSEE